MLTSRRVGTLAANRDGIAFDHYLNLFPVEARDLGDDFDGVGGLVDVKRGTPFAVTAVGHHCAKQFVDVGRPANQVARSSASNDNHEGSLFFSALDFGPLTAIPNRYAQLYDLGQLLATTHIKFQPAFFPASRQPSVDISRTSNKPASPIARPIPFKTLARTRDSAQQRIS
ncbi:MAG: hypothetical protein AVDCRST_MAG93-6645 [uncultured Chloroflexia bacterium]|uniref:Uncharacterized protein n=1 Tax=uncultured Chloroflexia bacterium TaxID=1672391 RepID=A0A6J4LU22_9CHLR|nr:MAG: hypothetical protein AVDCRST_MAG93-6645 [uncultured Chloroflexia bacterium]